MSQTVLAIDASSEGCSVALSRNGHISERISNEPRSHAQRLLPMVDELLAESDVALKQLDYLALVNGPGSFTGVRIALSVAQGLAYGAGLPIFCLSSLLTMAQQKRSELEAGRVVISALDARMGELYWAAFDFDETKKQISTLVKPMVSGIDTFQKELDLLTQRVTGSPELIGLGDGFTLNELSELDLGVFKIIEQDVKPSASALIALAQDLQPSAGDFVSAESVEPLYLRNEVAWKKRERIRQI